MIGWLILAAYIVGWLIFAPIIGRYIAKESSWNDDPDTGDKILGALLGTLAALFWPLIIPGGWVYRRMFPKKDDEA